MTISMKRMFSNPFPAILNSKVVKYFRESYSELRKVSWPSRKDTVMYSSIVLALSIAMAILIGVLDLGLSKGLEYLISVIPA